MTNLYEYNEDGIYIGEYFPQLLIDGTYSEKENTTNLKPDFDNTTHFAKYENDAWAVYEKQTLGTYYNKVDRSLYEVTSITDWFFNKDNYTPVAPPAINSGDVVYFDETTQTWLYSVKSNTTLAAELVVAKNAKKIECVAWYETKRVFRVQNGQSLLLIANQDLQNNIDAWVNKMEYDGSDFYQYMGINIPKTEVIRLKNYISYIRTTYVSLRDYHAGNAYGLVGQIDLLGSSVEVEAYDFTQDQNGNNVLSPEAFIIAS